MKATTGRSRMESLDADFDAETSAEIASLAQRRGWQVAAHDRMRALDDRAYRLAIDEYAAGLRVLLPLTEESRVLVLRCGWGAVALGLAECTDHVVAVDDRESRLRFLAARREQARTATLQIVQGCLTSGLPFGGEAFDAAILLDTIERVPGRDQAAALVAVRRVLVPGGSLLLGVPNRIGIVGPGGEGGHKRTGWGYRRVLLKAGYREPRFHAPLPSSREPLFILPLDQRRLFDHFVDGLFTAQDYRAKLEARGLGAAFRLGWALWRVARHLKLTGLARYAVPDYLITARA